MVSSAGLWVASAGDVRGAVSTEQAADGCRPGVKTASENLGRVRCRCGSSCFSLEKQPSQNCLAYLFTLIKTYFVLKRGEWEIHSPASVTPS